MLQKMRNKYCLRWNKISGCVLYILQIVIILIWTIYLCIHTDSQPSIYILCAVCSLYLLLFSGFQEDRRILQSRFLFPFLAVLFGLAVCAANYQVINSVPCFLLLWAGGLCVASICLNGFYYLIEKYSVKCRDKEAAPSQRAVRWLFFFCFFLICFINLMYLFLFRYPGCMNSDGIIQVTNGLYDIRANHFPYVHTLLLLVFLKVGLWFSGGLNLGIALYCCFQILFMALCFSWAVMTLYQKGIHRIFIAIAVICYAFMPYNIAYSCMVWKDVLFGGSVLLFITALLRSYCKMGRASVNYIFLILGGYGFALLRNNGWHALFLTFLVMVLLLRKKIWPVTGMVLLVLISTWILTHPVYDMLGVKPSEFTESLSVPVQQIARTITEDGKITEQQMEAINEVIDVETIPEKYVPRWSDPIKFSVNHELLKGQAKRYFEIWLEIGLKNPVLYLKAWIDQTKGYWNGGYEYWIWYTTIDENWFDGYGSIFQTVLFERGARWSEYLMNLFMRLSIFDAFRSIGFSVWLIGLCFAFALKRRDYLGIILTFPVIGTILTLWVATPVFSEFRYAYAVFTCLPFLMIITIGNGKTETV